MQEGKRPGSRAGSGRIQARQHHDAIDSTGIKMTNSGDWIRYKHGTPRRRFIKLHADVDINSKVITAQP